MEVEDHKSIYLAVSVLRAFNNICTLTTVIECIISVLGYSNSTLLFGESSFGASYLEKNNLSDL